MAGGEGHWGHRWAVDWMLVHVRPVLLFEQEDYLKKKERGGSFLPLEARLSMWTYFKPGLLIGVLPKEDPNIPKNDHYNQIFDQTGADYCFVTEGDPDQEEKRARGKPAGFTLIPHFPILTTTESVQKLLSDIDSLFNPK